jgi:hypothetical protein
MGSDSSALCPSCFTKLKLPAAALGRKVRCPQCKQSFAAPALQAPAAREAPTPASSADEPGYVLTDALPPSSESPALTGSADEPEDYVVADALPPTSAPQRPDGPKRRKKKREFQEPDKAPVPAWIWWWGSLAAAVLLTGVGLFAMARNGYPLLALYCSLSLVFALPISAFGFALSMLLSNWLGAGIELVEFSTLIPKALLLVLLANLLALVPCAGPFIALAVWFIGATLFFQLEIWEARFLVIVNWGMGWIIWLVLVGSRISLVTHKKFDGHKGDDRRGDPAPLQELTIGPIGLRSRAQSATDICVPPVFPAVSQLLRAPARSANHFPIAPDPIDKVAIASG